MTQTSLKGPKFWAMTAAISGLGSLSLTMTFFADVLRLKVIRSIPGDWLRLFNLGMFLCALATGALGFGSMLLCGMVDVGRITIRGRLLPRYAVPVICIPLYMAPWLLLLLVYVMH